MKLRAWLFTALFISMSFMLQAAPLYRAGQTDPSSWRKLLHGEISASYLFSNSYLEDYTGQVSSDRLRGVSARALWSPLAWLAVGAEYTHLGKVSLPQSMVDSYQVTQTGAIVKLTLSPDTNPRLYVVGGYGRSKHSLRFSAFLTDTTYTQPYWMAGLGVETCVYRAVFLAAEGNIYWNRTAYIHTYHKLSGHAYGALQLRAGLRF